MICPTKKKIIRCDSFGDGHLFASRGNRLHDGVDLCCAVGEPIAAPCRALFVRKLFVYPNDLRWTGVELRNKVLRMQLFYVVPEERLIGKEVAQGQIIGYAQQISLRYGEKMKNHYHWQINAINPLLFLGV